MDPLQSAESINSYFVNQVKDYAIFATDVNGIITAWNMGAERLKGYTEEEIVGQFYGILHPYPYQQAGHPEKELEIALKEGTYETTDWRKRKDDSLFWATVHLTPIFTPDGKHVGYTKITGDLTKQKELQDKLAERQQDALERKNTELQKINLDLDNFIYTASHDLRSPINNIEALVDILKDKLTEKGWTNSETEEILDRIMSSVNRFKTTVKDLTQISRLEKDSEEIQPDIVTNVKEVYDDIMADLAFQFQNHPCFIQTDFQVYQLNISRNNFRSILYNLISNAIKYRDPTRDCIIKINTRLEEPNVVLSVQDNGLGMDERQQEHLFTMFKRFHDHVEGTGVGLFMVKRIVENTGGKIEVESQKGQGTEFKVYFKAAM